MEGAEAVTGDDLGEGAVLGEGAEAFPGVGDALAGAHAGAIAGKGA